MANEDLHAEMELLRKQLEEMKNERQSATATPETAEPEPPGASETPDASIDAAAEAISSVTDLKGEELVAQLREVLDSLDKDIKDTKPTTLLLVFALGVLVGRL
jgi:hypothetical protein